MRALTAILALCGAYWALVGIAGWLLTFYSLRYIETTADVFKIIFTIILLTSGYFVWWGWVFYGYKERFPFVAQRTFWIVSLVHHVLCIFYMIPMDVWGGGDDPWWIPVWIIGNVVISATILARRPWIGTQTESVPRD